MNRQTWVDLTDISGWRGNFTGIQRAVYNLAYHFYQDGEARFFRYDEYSRNFYIADFAEIIRRFEASKVQAAPTEAVSKNPKALAISLYATLPNRVKRKMPGKVKWAAKKGYGIARNVKNRIGNLGHAPTVTVKGVKAEFSEDDVVLVFGNNWDRAIFIDDLAQQKVLRKFKLYQLVYDLIPIIGPQLFGVSLFAVYSKYLFEAVAASDGLFCISRSTQKDLEEFCERVGLNTPPSTVVRLGDTLEEVKARPVKRLESESFILCVGTLEIRKNHMLLYYAWKEAARQHIIVPKLVIVGKPGWLSEGVQHLLKHDPEVRSGIMVLNSVSDAELRWLYEKCLFSVYPSVYEGWGLPIAESLSYGKFCLASNTSSMPEIAGDLIDYFSPYDSGGCLKKILEYSQDSKRLQQKEDRIRRLYKDTDWHSTYEEVQSFVQPLT